ncbi:pyruvate kinase [Entophlyctis helioformis]|nr:pyruvate kinase [Entophlyctis helioformis]
MLATDLIHRPPSPSPSPLPSCTSKIAQLPKDSTTATNMTDIYLAGGDRPVQIKSKIICTIGPKTQSVEKLGQLVETGMNVMRMNFSHGSHEYHAQTVKNLRTYLASTKTPRIVAILLDTKGPEIRSGKLVGGVDKKLTAGAKFQFHNDTSRLGDETQVWTTYTSLAKTVAVGDRILVDDGLIGMIVEDVDEAAGTVDCIVENDGMLGETKGVNLPGNIVDLPAITTKDASDIQFGIEQGVDFIAASFIRKASDVLEIRKLIQGTGIKIISKIENQEGLENFDDILAVSDGIMVARGDLGVEIPVEQVARFQKMMIRKCNAAGKPVVTATQMLESMIVNPRPTRAEATDVANAVLDGTDCVMLSGETAKGSFPIHAVEMMSKICREAEVDINYSDLYPSLRRQIRLPISVAEAIAASAVKTSWDVHATLVIVLTQTGAAALNVSKYRPIAPVLAVTASPQAARQCQVLRGIYPLVVESMEGTENIIHRAMLWGVKMGMAHRGDPVVVTSGVLEDTAGSTNIMRVLKCVGFEV